MTRWIRLGAWSPIRVVLGSQGPKTSSTVLGDQRTIQRRQDNKKATLRSRFLCLFVCDPDNLIPARTYSRQVTAAGITKKTIARVEVSISHDSVKSGLVGNEQTFQGSGISILAKFVVRKLRSVLICCQQSLTPLKNIDA